jgi:pilus assembly protein CpaC
MGFLQILRTEGVTKILAEPRVTTMSGQWGYVISGGEVPLILPTGVGAPPSITYKQFGTIVQFRPIVKGNGKIYLQVRPELSQVDTALSASITGASAPGFQVRSAQVEVEIDEGQTLAIGGLIQNSVTASITRVPVLGDIPGLGVLFTSKNYSETEEELVILVTPRLVDPVDCTKIPKWLPGRETRSPDDFELFLEGIMEAPRGPRTLYPLHYQPAYKNASNAGQFPCAGGNCNTGNGAGCANGNCGVPNGMTTARPTYISPSAMPTMTTMPPATMPPMAPMAPSYPDVPAQPTMNNRIIVQPENPMAPMPPIRNTPQQNLGPATPTLPPSNPPTREFEIRPTLPPVAPQLDGPR